jgi:hypothetical protein
LTEIPRPGSVAGGLRGPGRGAGDGHRLSAAATQEAASK